VELSKARANVRIEIGAIKIVDTGLKAELENQDKAISYVAAQVFKHQIGSQFRATPHAQAVRTLRFDHVPPSAFLCTLKRTPEITQNGLKISADDWKLFKEMKDNSMTVLQALKAFKQNATVENKE
jgi:hypothetical protein